MPLSLREKALVVNGLRTYLLTMIQLGLLTVSRAVVDSELHQRVIKHGLTEEVLESMREESQAFQVEAGLLGDGFLKVILRDGD